MKHHKAVIGIGIEASTAFGRQILRGITRYANIHRTWLLMKEFNVFTTTPALWPKCDGAIVAMTDAPLSVLKENCKHVVSCSGATDPRLAPVVSMDDEAVGRLAADHLLECRLKFFGYYGAERVGVPMRREQGFRSALHAQGHEVHVCPVRFEWNRQLTSSAQAHWPALLEWLVSLPKPVGILASDDMTASDLAAACLEAGLHVPDQIAIIGVNNDDLLCESAWPPLSSVQCDYQRVGYYAAELLHRLLTDEAVSEEMLCVRMPPVGIVRRQSSDLVSVENADLAQALRFIREHACDPCSVSDVLREIPVSRRWLERNCVEQVGRTPYEAIIQVRMKRAADLLVKTELSLFAIAQTCGFSDSRNFRVQFQNTYGEAPGAFRRARKTK